MAPQTEIVCSFLYYNFYILYLPSSKLQIISELGSFIQKIMFHFKSSTGVYVHISLVDAASNYFFQCEHRWNIYGSYGKWLKGFRSLTSKKFAKRSNIFQRRLQNSQSCI